MSKRNVGREYKQEWTRKEDMTILDLYESQPLAADRLAYTAEFDHLYDCLLQACPGNKTKHHVFRRLIELRKKGNASLKGRASRTPRSWH